MSVAIEEFALVLAGLAGLTGLALGWWARGRGAAGESVRPPIVDSGGRVPDDQRPNRGPAPEIGATHSASADSSGTVSREEAGERARRLVAIAMERCAGDVVAQGSTATIALASEDLKGRLIGREGRNHRAFERAAGVDLIIEEDACAVTVSTLDPVRREAARRSIEALLAEGRIQPSRIEEIVARERAGLDGELPSIGEEAARRAGVHALPQPVLHALGALRFRTSASQNVLEHSVECATLGALIAAELGADVAVARRAALLHDIGKGLGSEWEGPHAVAGMAFLQSHGESEPVAHAVGAHHRDVEPASDIASCVIVADAVSGGRPGARKGDVAAMLERVSAMEELAAAFPGVEQAYAVQAGRDLRVIVRPEELDDQGAANLAQAIVTAASAHPAFRGPVHVTVIRESRFEADAK